ncbi:MAG TPA: CBS domain-containing protein [Acidimicrobiales bacterium]|nr:CBS domain-containing protein [Acidimicrobiales bacterium]
MPRLGDIMHTDVYTAAPDTTVSEAAKTMVKRRLGSVLVTRSDVLVGIFTERDVLRAAAAGTDLTTSALSAWMTSDPDTATADVEAEDAAQTMLAGGFRHLPVVEGNRICGVVSLRDVLATRIGRR